MMVVIVAFLCSCVVNLLIIRYSYLCARFSLDDDLTGVQKFHINTVPRIGGLGILLGLIVAFLSLNTVNQTINSFGLLLVVSAMPSFLFGFLEDLTKSISVNIRLLGCVISSILAGYLLNAWLPNLQIFGIDNMMGTYAWFAVLVTCFAVAGITNAFNIIDGYNGLSSMVGLIILFAIAYVALQLKDYQIVVAAATMMGAVAGFFFLNYPRGFVFIGDGGAYLVGFWIAELSVLLTGRHPEVSKWFPLLLCCYPVLETLFTIYRRIWIHRTSPSLPDAVHMHQIIYRRLVRWSVGSVDQRHLLIRNSLTAPYLWVLTLLSVIPAILFWDNVWLLRFSALLFAIIYINLYRSIIKFRAPKFLIIKNKSQML